MTNTKNLLIAAAVSGALASLPMVARAELLTQPGGPSVDKLGCQGKDGQKGDKPDKDKQKDKSACSGKGGCGGKEGCGGKDKQK